MSESLRRQEKVLQDLEKTRIDELNSTTVSEVTDKLWRIIAELKIGIGQSKIVAGTKALHHILPELVPPIDREYTVRFFLGNPNAIQCDESGQRQRFELMYRHLSSISVTCKSEIAQRLGSGMNSSTTKVVDNAIIGYVWSMLKTKSELE